MSENLSTQSPLQIDTELAALHGAKAAAEQARKIAVERIHSEIGERAQYVSRNRKSWPTRDDDAIAKAREIADASAYAHYRLHTANPRGAYDALVKLDAADARLSELRAAITTLDDEYSRRPWSRFFVVQGGHIHSSMSCSTCYPTTRFGWLPALSGKTEAEAVRDHGTILCSVCFPSAPVEWTVGKSAADKGQCEGGIATGNRRTVGMRLYGDCPTCGERCIVKVDGKVRAHKPKP